MTGNRAQIFTLEGVLAALVVVTGLIFAMQIVVLTPSTSGDATNPVASGELNSILETSADRGSDGPSDLKTSVLFWNPNFDDPDESDDQPVNLNGFRNSSSGSQFYSGTEFNESQGFLAPTLDDALDDSLSMNVLIHYRNSSGHINGSFPMILNGAPGANAVRASTTVVVYDEDSLIKNAAKKTRSDDMVIDANESSDMVFYAPDAYPESELYNVLEVEVIVWQR